MPSTSIFIVTMMTGWAWLVGGALARRLDRRMGESPEAWALAIPLGLGVLSLAGLALGMLGWLNGGALAGLAACLAGVVVVWRGDREVGTKHDPVPGTPHEARRVFCPMRWQMGSGFDALLWVVLAAGLIGTLLTALGPVTDGDALCYHLQVPKVFLEAGRVVYEPDLHETVYPLVAEMQFAAALAWGGGPVACRLLSWVLGVCFAGATTGLARPVLGRRAGWAGAVALLAPAVSNGMSAPLNDVTLATYATLSLWALMRWREEEGAGWGRAALVGLLCGLAIGVKYPALVWVGLLGAAMGWVALRRGRMAAVGVVAGLVVMLGGGWYARAAWHTGNPVHPFFRAVFGGAGLDEVLEPAKRPMAVTAWNLMTALGPMTLDPDRFDSVSHQFGPLFLVLLPGLLVLRPPRQVVGLVLFGLVFYGMCLTQRQSMRFVLPALGAWSVGAAWVAIEVMRRSKWAGSIVSCVVVAVLAGEGGLALGRSRHAVPVLMGSESVQSYLWRREPTYAVGRWMETHLPESARVVGQDHRGFYLPRPYVMELAHRRRTGLGADGSVTAEGMTAALRARGFTHVLLCPPVPEDAVEFDPTLGRILAPWTASREPVYRADLGDADGVVRRYAIYALDGSGTPVRVAGVGSR